LGAGEAAASVAAVGVLQPVYLPFEPVCLAPRDLAVVEGAIDLAVELGNFLPQLPGGIPLRGRSRRRNAQCERSDEGGGEKLGLDVHRFIPFPSGGAFPLVQNYPLFSERQEYGRSRFAP
jgi:hypothetical protein